MSSLLSVVVPSADPRFLARTVAGLRDNAAGPVEIIVSLDGIDPPADLPTYDNVRILRQPRAGMRAALNAARPYVNGDWVMKTDEHCLFAGDFDTTIKADCPDRALLIPRRYSLDAEHWRIENNPKGPRDYHYLTSPVWSIRERSDYSIQGMEWPERTRQRLHGYDVDETLSLQGSCYAMTRAHYERLGPLSEVGYGGFAQEPQELGLKTQLGGGVLLTTKRTFYAHLHKGKKYGRGYRPERAEIAAGHEYSAWYWMTDQWLARRVNMRDFIAYWLPLPGWPADTLERWGDYFPPGATLEQLKARALAERIPA